MKIHLPRTLLLALAPLCSLVVGSHGEVADHGQWLNSFPQPEYVTALAVDPTNPARIVAGSGIGKPLFATTDGGQTWAEVGDGLTGAASALAFDAGSPDRLYAGFFSGGVARSTDGGQHWTPVNEGLGNGHSPEVMALLADPDEAGVIYAGLRGGMTVIFAPPSGQISTSSSPSTVYHGGIYKSTDAGNTWHPAQTGIPVSDNTPLSVGALVFDPRNPENLYAGARAVYRSTDGAATWTPLPSDPPGRGEIIAIQIDPRDSKVLYVAKAMGGICKTTDGGETWIPASRGLQDTLVASLILDSENPDVLYAAAGESLLGWTGQSQIYRSDNGAASWNPFEPVLPSVYATYALTLTGTKDSRRLHAGTNGGVMSTRILSTSVFYLPHFGDGVSGELRLRTNLMLTNLGPEATVRVEFFSPEGNPLIVRFGDREPSSSLSLELKPGEVFSEWTAGAGPLVSGYARVLGPADVTGHALFACEQEQQVLYETGVPATRTPSRNVTFFFDSSDQHSNVGLAIVNRGDSAAAIEFTLYDQDFQVAAQRTLKEVLGHDLKSGEAISRYATEIFPEIRELSVEAGTITVQSDQDLAAMTLHEQRTGSTVRMSTFPVIPVRVDQERQPLHRGSLTFPQMADGRSEDVTFRTELVLVNTGADTTAHVGFLEGFGSAAEFDLENLGPKSVVALDLRAGQVARLKTTGEAVLHTGCATVVSEYGGEVWGFMAVVRTDEQSSTEATVMACPERLNFSFAFDASETAVKTGLALAGRGEVSLLTRVECDLYDESSQLIATRKFDFMPFGHYALFANELFPEIQERRIPRGLITVKGSEPLVPVVLREHFAAAPGFPKPLYRLTTLPVIPRGMD